MLTDCFRALHHWLNLNGLSLIVIGASARQVAESHVNSVDLGDVTALMSDSVKSLVVVLDDTLFPETSTPSVSLPAFISERSVTFEHCI